MALGGLAVHQPLGRGGVDKVPEALRNQLGIAIGKRAYKAYAS